MNGIPAERLYVSTTCLSGSVGYSQTVNRYREAGLERIELGFCSDLGAAPAALANDPEIDVVCHNYFLPDEPRFINLASGDQTIRQWSISYVERAIDFCAEHGVDLYSFHGGFRIDPDPGPEFDGEPLPYEEAFNNFVRGVETVADYAADRGVTLGIENNVVETHHLERGENRSLLFTRAEEFERLFNTVSAANLGILIDIGHLRVAAETLGFDPDKFAVLDDRTVGVHLHDNDGRSDGHRPVDPDGWAMAIYSKWFAGRDIPVIVESHFDEIDALLSTRERLTA